ncbi:MAG: hypothetical protein ACT6XY_05225 [Phreatobacter sp.]|jgi:hypothetical protein|uniref:hypothetical protein n=1 Tax=Phreatobacter sp. TaxID=1966341 RepID=UPI004035C403
MPKRTLLMRSVSLYPGTEDERVIVTLAEAIRYLDACGGGDPRWLRTRRILEEAKASGSLRHIRQATRAFEEAARILAPGFVARRLRSVR